MAEFNPLTADANLKSLATPEVNPLTQYFRQPKVYVTLPSKGKYYTSDALNMPDQFLRTQRYNIRKEL